MHSGAFPVCLAVCMPAFLPASVRGPKSCVKSLCVHRFPPWMIRFAGAVQVRAVTRTGAHVRKHTDLQTRSLTRQTTTKKKQILRTETCVATELRTDMSYRSHVFHRCRRPPHRQVQVVS